MILLIPTFYGTRDCENMTSVTSRNNFIMQNYSVNMWETIFTVCIKITRQILSKTSLHKHFQILRYNKRHYVLC
jgi:hypothetical protein